MEHEKIKKSIKDVKLAPSKGVRRPGASRATSSGDGSFQRAAAPKPKPARKIVSEDDDMEMSVSSRKVNRPQPNRPLLKGPATSKVSLKKRKTWNARIQNTGSTPKILIISLLLIGVVFLSSFVSYTYMVDMFKNPITLESITIDQENKVSFKIERGATTADIAKNLKKQDLVSNASIYRFLSKFNGYDGNYKAGTYSLCPGLNYEEIMVILTSNPESVKITIPEGFTTQQIANRLEANGVCTASAFMKAVETQDLSSYPFITEHKNRDNRLDGYLFPDTYEFDIDASPDTILYKMLNRFSDIYKPDYSAKASAMGLTQDEVIILASLVEKEARLASERATIAGVFVNRLNSKDLKKMQSCATIRYAYNKVYGTTLETVTKENTNIDDLYNTYKYDGLPPGPICNPGEEAIKAVLNYSHHDYYYFVVRDDGSNGHTFSKTYAEHVAAKGF